MYCYGNKCSGRLCLKKYFVICGNFKHNRIFLLCLLLSGCCQAVVIVAFFFSSSQDNILGIMESLLVCLKWCKEKVEQERGMISFCICVLITHLTDSNSKSVLYLHLLRCKTLQSTLKLFCENLEPISTPALSSSVADSLSIPSSNLSNHFLRVAIAAVDTVVYSTHAYKTEQVGLFISKDLSLPTGIRPNSKATVLEFTLAFTKFLLYYFHNALIADPKKVKYSVTILLVPTSLLLIISPLFY